ncbi:hypothetical protein JOF46_003831 [Paeniglutamicibacter psychrophenolicus]|uniref:Uncharacterized protein n=1 Tax=Paeniglutamicibacter psychrophenolicus TaxID=257454 RepID=A0ABS4WI76_9MICC|nr:hypothetical protein [Paeniglutamicibacter psychrophenolicus]
MRSVRNPYATATRGHALRGAVLGVLLGLVLTACTFSVRDYPTEAKAPEFGALGLPLVAWEGGPAYWNQFPKAKAGGWTDPSFFPIVAWYNGVSDEKEVQFDKSLGINTYIGMPDTLDASLLDEAGVFWIGRALNETFTAETKSWVGYILDDEVDGRFEPKEGRAHLQEIKDQVPDGLFTYANFTYMVLENDLPRDASEKYINDYTDAVSVDKYWYSIPHCSNEPYRDVSLVPVDAASCRSSSSYGKTMDALRMRDAVDGKLQPLWQFIENMGGTDNEAAFTNYIQPDQLRGAVMNSIIHEARGILYFNQSFAGPCKGSNVFRLDQVLPNFCGAAQVDAAKQVNNEIHRLAPVINTQSLEFGFGKDLDTMLKVSNGDAYIFSMLSPGSQPGKRQFTLPEGVSDRNVEVLFESRNLEVDSDGRFTDTFKGESAYHIYKVKL